MTVQVPQHCGTGPWQPEASNTSKLWSSSIRWTAAAAGCSGCKALLAGRKLSCEESAVDQASYQAGMCVGMQAASKLQVVMQSVPELQEVMQSAPKLQVVMQAAPELQEVGKVAPVLQQVRLRSHAHVRGFHYKRRKGSFHTELCCTKNITP